MFSEGSNNGSNMVIYIIYGNSLEEYLAYPKKFYDMVIQKRIQSNKDKGKEIRKLLF